MSSINDPISDLLTRIRNAVSARHRFVDVDRSKFKRSIVILLLEQGYIENYIEKDLPHEGSGVIRIFLKYGPDSAPIINRIDRVSSPGKRTYVDTEEIPLIHGGMGIAIVSTSQGVMTGREARKRKIGGEFVGSVW